ncbi:uncharacterized protein LOC124270143 isoform X1 [Haliotis rubra]|uniref:uncharacterized protein LOC124270143 isoform X1 n=1 Tax=Haliotis rubra TaxID=36100 RepID=UPI001EE4EBDE|nr:uncharacterized protein LOC124270143 isoform X1 [Haliotis rubra]
MAGSSKSLLPPASMFLFVWILSFCLLSGNGQAPPQPTLGELSTTVQQLLSRFNTFQGYVEYEINKLWTALKSTGPNGYEHPVDLQPTKAKVEVNPAKDSAVYTIEYKAIKEPRVIWRVNTEPAGNSKPQKNLKDTPGSLDGAISDEGIITKVFRNGKGTTTLRIHPSKEIVASVIVDHVTFVLSFRPNPNKTAEVVLRPTNFDVDAGPHGSFNYFKKKAMKITVSSPKFYPGFTSPNDYQWSFWMANTTAVPQVIEEYPQWREIQGGVVRVGPIRTLKKNDIGSDLKITYELMTDKGDYDGILIFSKYYTATERDSVLTGLTEMRYVFVHRSDRYDPFPKGFIAFVRRDPPLKPCISNQTCSIACHAVGVVPERIRLYKVQIDKSLMEVKLPKLEVREPYMLYNHYGIKQMMEEDEGEYVCVAFSGTKHTEMRTSLLLSEPVEYVNTSSGVVYGPETVTVTCAARGRPLPHVTMFENYAYQNEINTMQPYYRVERTVSRIRGEHIATMTVFINRQYMPVHLWRIICMFDNPFQLSATDFEISVSSPGLAPAMGPRPAWGNPAAPPRNV